MSKYKSNLYYNTITKESFETSIIYIIKKKKIFNLIN